ncbi:hypothetical protein GCM10022393_29510 [Aquimarina addita]|uniref:TonB C-terminal domain-containing protein n=1 Tax=Aquimarina addita TaxID=870485 RepID=A0ABP6UN04_9FLAO
MNKLLLVLLILSINFSFAQEEDGGILLSSESANGKGITPLWPKCEDSRQTPINCFNNNLRNHIIKIFRYPEAAREEGLEGTITVEFIINKKGKVEVIDVKDGHRYLQREAVRIIKTIPKMDEPAKWGNKPISVAYTVPITFIKPK